MQDNAAAQPDVSLSWYIAPKPPPPQGWLVFSRELLLRGLQGQAEGSAEGIRATAKSNFLLTFIVPALYVIQGIVFALAKVPLVNKSLEMAVTFWPRGALGFLLRGAYWKARLKKLGQDTLIDRGVEIWGAGNIEIGAACHIDTYVRLAAGEEGFGQKGEIILGDYVHLGPGAHVAGRGSVRIDDCVSLQARVHVYSASNTLLNMAEPGKLLSFSHTAPAGLQHTIEGPVRIEEYASVGFASLILPGVTIGRAAVVHPYCQIVTSFPAFANVVGPGRAKQNGWRKPMRMDPRAPAANAAQP